MVLYKKVMRNLFGCPVPSAACAIEIKTMSGGRPRVLYKSPIEEGLSGTVTEDTIIDEISADPRFWEWIHNQIKNRRITPSSTDGAIVKLRLIVCFYNQDGSLAVLDTGSIGQTSWTTTDAWEFMKPDGLSRRDDPMLVISELCKLMIEQQKALPDMLVRLFREASEGGKLGVQSTATESAKLLQSSAMESAKILASAMEPMKAQLAILDKTLSGETIRANKSTDAVIRAAMSEADKADPISKLLDEPEKLMGLGVAIFSMLDKVKKYSN